MEDNGHWEYPGEFDVTEWFGFVYRIINNQNQKHYLGKKQFHSITRKKIKDRKNRKVIRKESDWRKYTGSSTYLNADIDEIGKENFTFLIESLHKTKGSLHYREIEMQVDEDVLRATVNEGTADRKYYNKMIGHIRFLPPEEHSEETRHKIRTTLRTHWRNTDQHYYDTMSNEEKHDWDMKYRIGENNATKRAHLTDESYKLWLLENFKGANNPMFGRSGVDSPRWGTKHTIETRQQISNKIKGMFAGEKNPRYGKHPHENLSEERIQEIKDEMSERMSGENNPMFGRNVWLELSDEEVQIRKQKISNATKGKPKSETTKQRMRKPKGPQKLIVCPHCNKEGGVSNMTRYHMDNCKHKK